VRRKSQVRGAWLLVPLLCACFNVPIAGLCGDFESGCSSSGLGSSSASWRVFISGFPAERVDRTTVAGLNGYRGTLRVGDTVTFRLVVQIDSVSPSPVTIVKWELADSAVARITSDSGGVGTLTAIAPGKLLPLVANGTAYSQVFACDARNVCAAVADIDIVQ